VSQNYIIARIDSMWHMKKNHKSNSQSKFNVEKYKFSLKKYNIYITFTTNSIKNTNLFYN